MLPISTRGLNVASTASPQYIDPSQAFRGDQGASRLLGRLSRAQWDDWKARFQPYIQRMGSYATNEAIPGQTGRQASQAVGLAFDQGRDADRMQRERYGVSPTSAQRRANQRSTNLNRQAAMVSAGNQARTSERDRQQDILAGGMGLENIPDEVLNR